MSLIVAIRDKNRIVLGADKQMSCGNSKNHLTTKIWEVPSLNGAIMGSVGSARATQVVQYADIIDKNMIYNNIIPTEFIVNSLIPNLKALLKANNINITTPDDSPCELMPNSFIFAYYNRAWLINSDFTVIELFNYEALGSGADIAKGALYASFDKTPFERIILGIDAAAENTLYVDNEIEILTTYEDKNDQEQWKQALNFRKKALKGQYK